SGWTSATAALTSTRPWRLLMKSITTSCSGPARTASSTLTPSTPARCICWPTPAAWPPPVRTWWKCPAGAAGRPARGARSWRRAGVRARRRAAGRKSRPGLACWVVRIWEPDPPEGVKEPLEWVLLTSVETVTLEQMKTRRDWYTVRWNVEVYHDVEKNGCSEED